MWHFYMFWVPLAIDFAHISYPNTDFNESSECSPDFLKLSVMDVEILGATDKTTGFRGMSAREQKIYCKLFQNINVKH